MSVVQRPMVRVRTIMILVALIALGFARWAPRIAQYRNLAARCRAAEAAQWRKIATERPFSYCGDGRRRQAMYMRKLARKYELAAWQPWCEEIPKPHEGN